MIRVTMAPEIMSKEDAEKAKAIIAQLALSLGDKESAENAIAYCRQIDQAQKSQP